MKLPLLFYLGQGILGMTYICIGRAHIEGWRLTVACLLAGFISLLSGYWAYTAGKESK